MMGAIVRFGGDEHSCLPWWKVQTSLSVSDRQDCQYSDWAAKSAGRHRRQSSHSSGVGGTSGSLGISGSSMMNLAVSNQV